MEKRTRKLIIEIRTGKGIGEKKGKSDGRERWDRECREGREKRLGIRTVKGS